MCSECRFSSYVHSTTGGTQNSGWMKGGRRGRGSKDQDILEREGMDSKVSPPYTVIGNNADIPTFSNQDICKGFNYILNNLICIKKDFKLYLHASSVTSKEEL